LHQLRTTGRITDDFETGNWTNPSSIDEMEAVYRAGYARMNDPAFSAGARRAAYRLQQHKEPEYAMWRIITEDALFSVLKIYEELQLDSKRHHRLGESYYGW